MSICYKLLRRQEEEVIQIAVDCFKSMETLYRNPDKRTPINALSPLHICLFFLWSKSKSDLTLRITLLS
ncbi:hypothetical protein LINGRAPRIM_LOCUS3402, partial [Linum grandiflorum]